MKKSEFDSILEEESKQAIEESLRRRIFASEERVLEKSRDAKVARKDLKERDSQLYDAYTELSLYKKEFKGRPNWTKPRKRQAKHHATLVAFLSDMHYGEVVRAKEIGGYNEYNMEIAEERTKRFFEKTILLPRNYMAGVTYDGIVLPLGGDIVTGDIHEELRETNEFSTLRTVEIIVPWLTKGIEMLANEFGKVHVVSIPGNHPRNSVKPRYKKRSENNADTHIARLVAMQLASSDITFDIPESFDVDFQIYNHVFSLEHGDALKFNGTSEIGLLGPVKRGTLRKSRKRLQEGRPFNYLMCGHFHQHVPAWTQGFCVNGSIKGYDEFASINHFQPEPAQQNLSVVTPEYGVTMTMPIFVEKEN